MKAQLDKVLITLTQLSERAENLANSDSEKTSEKYADIPGYLEDAMEAIANALSELEDK